ncbi:MAG: hypothetical protein E7Z64_06420 [Thermoplasmata archaeon]|nr:hypothetical protein [Thermoplasmata archaeon]
MPIPGYFKNRTTPDVKGMSKSSIDTTLDRAQIINNGSINILYFGELDNYDVVINYGTISVAGESEDEFGVLLNGMPELLEIYEGGDNYRGLIDNDLESLADNEALIDNCVGGTISISGIMVNYKLFINHGSVEIVSEIRNGGILANDIINGTVDGDIICDFTEKIYESGTSIDYNGQLKLIIPEYSVYYTGEDTFEEEVETGFGDSVVTMTFATSDIEFGDYYYKAAEGNSYLIQEYELAKVVIRSDSESETDSSEVPVDYDEYWFDLFYGPDYPGIFSIIEMPLTDSWVDEPAVSKKYGEDPVITGTLQSGNSVDNLSVKYYSDADCENEIEDINSVNAGETIFVKIFYDGEDYPPFEYVKQVTIAKGDYDMSGVSFKDASKRYNRLPQHIEISGKLPVGADGSSPTVSYSGSAKTASDGPTRITASFSTTSPNYNAPRSMTAMLTIIGPDAPASPTYDDTGSSGSTAQNNDDDGGDKVDSVVVACIAAIASAAAIIVAIVFFRAH